MKNSSRNIVKVAGIILVFGIGLACCPQVRHKFSSKTNTKVTPKEWKETNYELCTANVIPGIKIPFDIEVTLNRMDLPFGRYDSSSSMRPNLIFTNGESKDIGSPIVKKFGQTDVEASRFSSDGSQILISSVWVRPEQAMLEDAVGEFIFSSDNYRGDVILYDLKSDSYSNLTEKSPSFYNVSGMFLPLGGGIEFGAMIDGQMKPYVLNTNGIFSPFTNTPGFTYGLDFSPDGKNYAFHADYKIFIGDMTTKAEKKIETSYDFNFTPKWSPDSKKLAWFCGQTNICVSDSDGRNVELLVERHGPFITVPFTDGADFHNGNSDNLVWSYDSKGVIYADLAKDNEHILLFKANVDNKKVSPVTTVKANGHWDSFPALSKDGKYLAYTSQRTGKRDLFMMNLETKKETQVTDLIKGCASRHPRWRP